MDTPRLLNDHDQELSDRAVDAALRASPQQREFAWHLAVWRGRDERDQVFVYQAAILLTVGERHGHPTEAELHHWADELAAVHDNHTAAVAARKEAHDG